MTLISKLDSFNIRMEIIEINEKQKVAVNRKELKWHKVTSGIPQVVGFRTTTTWVFVLYINDLPKLTKSDTLLFATTSRCLELLQIKMTRTSYNMT